jgi:hypothetical protein
MSVQISAITSSDNHSPILRGVAALITFFHQLNMAARFPDTFHDGGANLRAASVAAFALVLQKI